MYHDGLDFMTHCNDSLLHLNVSNMMTGADTQRLQRYNYLDITLDNKLQRELRVDA